MQGEARRAAVDAYKKRETAPGIFLVRCLASGEAWIGAATDIDAIRNRVWFGLAHGSHPIRAMQAAWIAHGEAQFELAVLERLEAAETPYLTRALMKERLAHWRAETGAAAA